MNCLYCGARNEEEDHRCHRCGRRLRSTPAHAAPEVYPTRSSAAPALRYDYDTTRIRRPVARTASGDAIHSVTQRTERPAVQQALFRDVPLPRVIPFESIATERTEAPPRKRNTETAARREKTAVRDDQTRLDLDPPAPRRRKSFEDTETVICCYAPVASPMHRFFAAVADMSLVGVALGIFGTIFYLAGGEIVLTKTTIPVYAAIPLLIAIFYRLLYCLGNGDTPGLRWLGLRLVDFDGRAPNRMHRLWRILGGCLSFVAGGLGLFWALTSEERLTWHDHISTTFPTVRF